MSITMRFRCIDYLTHWSIGLSTSNSTKLMRVFPPLLLFVALICVEFLRERIFYFFDRKINFAKGSYFYC